MRDIRPIVALAVLDEDFRPDQIGNGRYSDLVIKKSCGLRVFEPIVGNRRDKIRRAEDEIDVEFPFEDLCDPAFVQNLRLVSKGCELIKDLRIIAGFYENIDILGGTAETGIVVDGESPSDHESKLRVFQYLKDFR